MFRGKKCVSHCRHPILYLPKFGISGLDDDTILSIIMQLRIVSLRKRFGKAYKLKTKVQKPNLTKKAYASFKWRMHLWHMHLQRCIRHSNTLHLKAKRLKVVYTTLKLHMPLWDIPWIVRFPYKSQLAMWGTWQGLTRVSEFRPH